MDIHVAGNGEFSFGGDAAAHILAAFDGPGVMSPPPAVVEREPMLGRHETIRADSIDLPPRHGQRVPEPDRILADMATAFEPGGEL